MNRFLVLLALLAMPFSAHAATADLALLSDAISFSDELISGSQVRVYAQVTNIGDQDVSGYVTFFQGSLPIGDSQVISVRAGGVPEEVYVDFIVPSGSFNIRAEIRGTDPSDESSDNDSAFTPLQTPIQDDDRDGVSNDLDNCDSTSNVSQTDSDRDGEGNACDEDDDNDTVTDDVEEELGSSPTSSDSDGDGVADAKDAYPTDASRSVVAAPVSVPAAAPAAAPAVATPAPAAVSVAQVAPQAASVRSTETTADVPSSEPEGLAEGTSETTAVAHTDLTFSSTAIFSYSRASWNTFAFTAVTPQTSGYQYYWDFGDGVTSSRGDVEHTYASPGSFTVTFRVTDPTGAASQDTAVVRVPFWSFQNRLVWMLLAGLSLMLLGGIAAVVKLSRRPVARHSVEEEDEAFDASATNHRSVRVRVLDENDDA